MVEVIQIEFTQAALHALQDAMVEHLLTNISRLILIVRNLQGQPIQNEVSSAALGEIAEPSNLEVLHLDIPLHFEGPLFKAFYRVVYELLKLQPQPQFLTPFVFLVILSFFVFLGGNASFIRDPVDDFVDFVLDVVLVDEG